VPQHIATWNPTTQLWESEEVCLFSGQPVPWSEPFPTSGIAVGGRLFPLPVSAHRIAANESSSLLPKPVVNDMGDNKTPEWWDDWVAQKRAQHGNNGHGPSLAIEMKKLQAKK
jgi:hypothetical protein